MKGGDSVDKREIQTTLLSRYTYADDFRKQYDDRVVEWYKLYVGYRDPLPPEKADRSNLHIPRTYEEIDTLRSRIVKSMTASRPYIDFLPAPMQGATPETIAANRRKADIAAAVVDMQLERNNFVSLLYDFVTAKCIFPAAIMAVGWRYEMRPVRRRVWDPLLGVFVEKTTDEVVWDDNELVNVDFFDFWPDPRGRDLDSCRFVIQREWLTQDEIQAKLDLLKDLQSGTVYPLDYDRLQGNTGEEGHWRRLQAIGIAPETRIDVAENGMPLFEVLHYWEDTKHGILVNQELAYYGDSPYWRHGKKPFIMATFEPLPHEIYGMSAVQIIEHLQHELNTHRNQRVDNVSFVLNRMWRVDPGADIDEAELVSRPHGVIYAAKDQIEPLQTPDITASSYREEEVVKQDMENALAVPPMIRGTSNQTRQTATEIVTQSSNAGIRFDTKIALFESLALKRLAYLMDCNNQQFIDKPRLVKLFGPRGEEWQMIEPGDLIGEFDYRPAGSSVDPAANKEVRRAQLSQLVSIMANNPYVDQYELTKLLLESYDIRNAETLLRSPQTVTSGMLPAAQGLPQTTPAAPAALPQALAQIARGGTNVG